MSAFQGLGLMKLLKSNFIFGGEQITDVAALNLQYLT
jgi:hypothetical protein